MKSIYYMPLVIGSLLLLIFQKNFASTESILLNQVNPDTLFSPTLYSPYQGQCFKDGNCKMCWSSCGEDVTYEILLSTNADFSEVAKATSKDTLLNKTFKPKEAGRYYWKVRAVKDENLFSRWTAYYYFDVFTSPVIDIAPGCSGNCSKCPHPCGRRRKSNY